MRLKRYPVRLMLAALLGSLGCTKDLQRVHTPDLLTLDAPQTTSARNVAFGLNASEITHPSQWVIYSSLRNSDHLTDQTLETIAYSDRPEMKDQYILIDLGELCEITQVTQIHPPEGGFPRKYRIDAAGEHNFPYSLAYVGTGAPARSDGVFASTIRARFLRITLLETSEEPWRVAQIEVR